MSLRWRKRKLLELTFAHDGRPVCTIGGVPHVVTQASQSFLDDESVTVELLPLEAFERRYRCTRTPPTA